MKMYEVGGCVRDEILGVNSKDIDYSVVLDESDLRNTGAEDNLDFFNVMTRNLRERGFKIFLETPEHLTVRAQFPKIGGYRPQMMGLPTREGMTADFVLARKEGEYTDGRRPDTVEPGTLFDDLARRDFTMNAIAKDENGEHIDPFNGQQDIEDRIIRAVGNPLDRLAEDALRAVRALRFRVTKGFICDGDLCVAMQHPEVIDAIRNNISDERIQVELSKMFRFNTSDALEALGMFPLLTDAMFAGNVSLDATLKTKGRGK